MLKRIFTIILLLIVSLQLCYALPRRIPIQAKLRFQDSSSINGLKTVSFKLYANGDTSNPIWEETHDNILFYSNEFKSISLGGITPLDDSIFMNADSLTIGVSLPNDFPGEEALHDINTYGFSNYSNVSLVSKTVPWEGVENKPKISDLEGEISNNQIPENSISITKIKDFTDEILNIDRDPNIIGTIDGKHSFIIENQTGNNESSSEIRIIHNKSRNASILSTQKDSQGVVKTVIGSETDHDVSIIRNNTPKISINESNVTIHSKLTAQNFIGNGSSLTNIGKSSLTEAFRNEIENLIVTQQTMASVENTYSKSESDQKFRDKAIKITEDDLSNNLAAKFSDIQNTISSKVESNDVYKKTETYSKSESDNKFIAVNDNVDIENINGIEDYVTSTDLDSILTSKLDATAKALDADKLDGKDSTFYSNYNNLENKPQIAYASPIPADEFTSAEVGNIKNNSLVNGQKPWTSKLEASAKAVDSDKLDGLDSTQFVQITDSRLSDKRQPAIDSSVNGDLIFNKDGKFVRLPAGNEMSVLTIQNGFPSYTQKTVDTKLTESEVDEFVANNGYVTLSELSSGGSNADTSATSKIGIFDSFENSDPKNLHELLVDLDTVLSSREDSFSLTMMNLKNNALANGSRPWNSKLDIGSKAVDSDKLDGFDSSAFVLQEDLESALVNKLDSSSISADSDKLDGKDSTFYQNYANLTNKPQIAYTSPIPADEFTSEEVDNIKNNTLSNGTTPWTSKLEASAKAVDSDKLDGIDSTSFILESELSFGGSNANTSATSKIGVFDSFSNSDPGNLHELLVDFDTTLSNKENSNSIAMTNLKNNKLADGTTPWTSKLEANSKAVDSDKIDGIDSTQFVQITDSRLSDSRQPLIADTMNGDLMYFQNGSWIRLPAGSNGQTLVISSGKPIWGNTILSDSDIQDLGFIKNSDLTTGLQTKLDATAKAVDSEKFDGNTSAFYLNYSNLTNKPAIAYTSPIPADQFTSTEVGNIKNNTLSNGTTPWTSKLEASAKSVDSDKLDGIDSTSFILESELSSAGSNANTSATSKIGVFDSFSNSDPDNLHDYLLDIDTLITKILNASALPKVSLTQDGIIPKSEGQANKFLATDSTGVLAYRSINKEAVGLGDVENINVRQNFAMNDNQSISLDILKARDNDGITFQTNDNIDALLIKDDGSLESDFSITATSFSGSLNASDINSGKLSNDRLDGTVSILGSSIESDEITSLDGAKLTGKISDDRINDTVSKLGQTIENNEITSLSYNKLTEAPTLGSIASQNSSAVSITGGSATGLSEISSSALNVSGTAKASSAEFDTLSVNGDTLTVINGDNPRIGIRTSNPDSSYALEANGKVKATEIIVPTLRVGQIITDSTLTNRETFSGLSNTEVVINPHKINGQPLNSIERNTVIVSHDFSVDREIILNTLIDQKEVFLLNFKISIKLNDREIGTDIHSNIELTPDSEGFFGYNIYDSNDQYLKLFKYERFVALSKADNKLRFKIFANRGSNSNDLGIWPDFNPVFITFTYTTVSKSEVESMLMLDANHNASYIE